MFFINFAEDPPGSEQVCAAALNLVRMGAWLMEMPRAQTRVSRFARLAPAQQKAA